MTTVDAMIRRLGAGDTKDEAATFAYRTLAAPMLIGTLVTIAGFVPIGFAAELGRRVHLLDLLGRRHLAHRLVARRGDLRAADRHGASSSRPRPEADAKPGKLLQRLQRASCSGAIRANWLTIGLTLARVRRALFLLRFVPQQFFPASDRPELMVDLTLRAERVDLRHRGRGQAPRGDCSKGDPDVDHCSTYVGRGAIRFILTLNVQLANPFFAQFVIVAKDFDGARAAAASSSRSCWPRSSPTSSRASRRWSSGPPVGWPLQYRVSGPDKDEVRRIALELAAGAGRRPAHAARQLRLDGAGAPAAHQDRPGPGAPARRQLAQRWPACSTPRSPARR